MRFSKLKFLNSAWKLKRKKGVPLHRTVGYNDFDHFKKLKSTSSLMDARMILKGSDQRENRGVWSNINTRYLVWRCGDGRSFFL